MHDERAHAGWPEIYRQRRNAIRAAVGGGIILWLGNLPQPRNYANCAFPFRQNSHFLYCTGLSDPNLALLSFPDSGYDILFSRPATIDDTVWGAAGQSRVDMARHAGVETAEDISRLGVYLAKAHSQGLTIHYLPPYQASSTSRLAELLTKAPGEVTAGASRQLMEAVAGQRMIKSELEIAEIEDALGVTDRMHRAAMVAASPGVHEYEIAGAIQGIALSCNRQQAFNPIVSVHGEVLHNESYDNILAEGQLLLNDSGAESPRYYASDITRTFPVSGRFDSVQAEVYQIVLQAQMGAIDRIKPGVAYSNVHREAARIMTEGLRGMGLMRGDPADAVEAGAHALFFPHGIGHMLGLDVHDMEDLGDVVGYSKGQARSNQFGMNYLRLSRSLEAGFVLTVEPGIYFIPALIEKWRQERLHREFISYEALAPFLKFGGIRIEDDVLVTPTGARVLGPGIPRTIPEVEEAMGAR
jgi:Xaa-Pro aminopeptidase